MLNVVVVGTGQNKLAVLLTVLTEIRAEECGSTMDLCQYLSGFPHSVQVNGIWLALRALGSR